MQTILISPCSFCGVVHKRANFHVRRKKGTETTHIERLDRAMLMVKEIEQKRNTLRRTIYMLQVGEIYKIGFSIDMDTRLKDYKIYFPVGLKVLLTAKTPNYREFENWVDGNFTTRHVGGEWYKFTNEDVEQIKQRWFSETKEVHQLD